VNAAWNTESAAMPLTIALLTNLFETVDSFCGSLSACFAKLTGKSADFRLTIEIIA
jgi:hypothetical protein